MINELRGMSPNVLRMSPNESRCRGYKSFLLSEMELCDSEAELFESSAPAVGDNGFISNDHEGRSAHLA